MYKESFSFESGARGMLINVPEGGEKGVQN